MVDKTANSPEMPPVFGPNGVVLNAPTMTDEMRAEIESEYKSGVTLKDIAVQLFVMITIWVAIKAMGSDAMHRGGSLVIAAVILATLIYFQRRSGLSYLRSIWRGLTGASIYLSVAFIITTSDIVYMWILIALVVMSCAGEWLFNHFEKTNP